MSQSLMTFYACRTCRFRADRRGPEMLLYWENAWLLRELSEGLDIGPDVLFAVDVSTEEFQNAGTPCFRLDLRPPEPYHSRLDCVPYQVCRLGSAEQVHQTLFCESGLLEFLGNIPSVLYVRRNDVEPVLE